MSLRTPGGQTIQPYDTSAASGLMFFQASNVEGFSVASPEPGDWMIHLVSSAPGPRGYGYVVSYAGQWRCELDPVVAHPLPGDAIHLRGRVTDGTVPRTDVVWSCLVVSPTNAVRSVTMFDDGLHDDLLSGDGTYGGITVTPDGPGLYRALVTATTGIGTFETSANCEAVAVSGVAIDASDISFSRNVTAAGETSFVRVAIHNVGTMAVHKLPVLIRDVSVDRTIKADTVDVAPLGSFVLEAPWVFTAPDSHLIRVQLSPFAIQEADYSDNMASRLMVLGSPLGVEADDVNSSVFSLDPPRPNPTAAGAVLSFALSKSSHARLMIVDPLGRRIREWRWNDLQAGPHSIVWDGLDRNGIRVSAGVYLSRLEVAGEARTRRIVVRK